MKGLYIIVVIAGIVAVSKLAMEYLKTLDIKNGLVIDDSNYSIKGTLFNSIKQDKRIKKENKKHFKDYEIDSAAWKKCFFLFIGAIVCAVIESLCEGKSILPILLISVSLPIHYFSKRLYYLLVFDICYLFSLCCISYVLISVIIIAPAVVLYNYVVWKDYKNYKKSLREKTE